MFKVFATLIAKIAMYGSSSDGTPRTNAAQFGAGYWSGMPGA